MKAKRQVKIWRLVSAFKMSPDKRNQNILPHVNQIWNEKRFPGLPLESNRLTCAGKWTRACVRTPATTKGNKRTPLRGKDKQEVLCNALVKAPTWRQRWHVCLLTRRWRHNAVGNSSRLSFDCKLIVAPIWRICDASARALDNYWPENARRAAWNRAKKILWDLCRNMMTIKICVDVKWVSKCSFFTAIPSKDSA